ANALVEPEVKRLGARVFRHHRYLLGKRRPERVRLASAAPVAAKRQGMRLWSAPGRDRRGACAAVVAQWTRWGGSARFVQAFAQDRAWHARCRVPATHACARRSPSADLG